MKNVSSIKANKVDSPKTAGGISKALLTPCRRVGLSRNWKKAGPSPFVSPLTSNDSPKPEQKVEEQLPRKRKQREIEEKIAPEIEDSNLSPTTNTSVSLDINKSDEIVGTPSRHVTLPRKKKSKLLSALNTNLSEVHNTCSPRQEVNSDKKVKKNTENISLQSTHDLEVNIDAKQIIESTDDDFQVTKVVTPSCTLSKGKSYKISEPKVQKEATIDIPLKENVEIPTHIKDSQDNEFKCKTSSPNELTKECIVVIQKKIFKTDKKGVPSNNKIETKKTDDKKQNKHEINNSSKIKTLQFDEKAKKTETTFDSDSDDVALCNLKDKKNIENKLKTENIDDEHFEENQVKISKLKDRTTSITGLKTKPKSTKVKPKLIAPIELSSQSSFDDDDDFEFQTKKTILIRKCYDKVSKPLKARSTGSITQRDIDQLRSKIEAKKKLLLAKAVCDDTEELRGLIKKWQRGCQDALMELMELMKHKYQDKQNMDYAEMLKSLKIPATMVGYDEENDCFITPDDSTIVLSKFNNL